jgi:hypothetical protein
VTACLIEGPVSGVMSVKLDTFCERILARPERDLGKLTTGFVCLDPALLKKSNAEKSSMRTKMKPAEPA